MPPPPTIDRSLDQLPNAMPMSGSNMLYVRKGVPGAYTDHFVTWDQILSMVPAGAQGLQGLQGLKGDKGDTGSAGSNGTNGTNGTNGADATQLQRERLQTNASGDLVWTYPVPYGAGVVPRVNAIPEGSAGNILNVQLVGTPTNTQATFKVTSLPTVNVLGIFVLGAPTNIQCYLHLFAAPP